MDDSRLTTYRHAIIDIATGGSPRSLPVDGDDDVARLGKAIVCLSETLKCRFAEHERLAQITAQANAGSTLDEVCSQLYDSFHPLIPYDRIGFALLENDSQTLRARWGRSKSDKICLEVGFDAPMAGSSLQAIVDTGHPRILNDLEAYLRDHPDSESTRLMVSEGVRSSLTCPLVAAGRPIGFLFFSSFEKNTYRDLHVDRFMRIADQLASIAENSRLQEEVQHLRQRLQTSPNDASGLQSVTQ